MSRPTKITRRVWNILRLSSVEIIVILGTTIPLVFLTWIGSLRFEGQDANILDRVRESDFITSIQDFFGSIESSDSTETALTILTWVIVIFIVYMSARVVTKLLNRIRDDTQTAFTYHHPEGFNPFMFALKILAFRALLLTSALFTLLFGYFFIQSLLPQAVESFSTFFSDVSLNNGLMALINYLFLALEIHLLFILIRTVLRVYEVQPD